MDWRGVMVRDVSFSPQGNRLAERCGQRDVAVGRIGSCDRSLTRFDDDGVCVGPRAMRPQSCDWPKASRDLAAADLAFGIVNREQPIAD